MAATLEFLAKLVGGELHGDGHTPIDAAAPLAEAVGGAVTLIDRAEMLAKLAEAKAAAVVAPNRIERGSLAIPAILVDDAHEAFSAIVQHFRPPRSANRVGVSPAAHVSPTARLDDDVDVHPGATIGEDVSIGRGSTIHAGVHIMAGCQIGAGTTIFPNCVLYENSVVGERVILHAGTVIGSYGFGYKQQAGAHHRTAQLGYVRIENDVEIGANATIDRGSYGATVIGEGTKLDNLVMIAHNCHIGRHNLICSQVGIAGSSTTGDWVVMAGQVGVRDHVHIGNGAVLGAMAGITNDVPDGACMMGIPATPEREQKLKQAALAKLPEMRKELKALHQMVASRLADDQSSKEAEAA
jgi:UDP-3-O-[3-hydroxymyristoyl] glucosamine N-acyltransferase